MRGPHGGHETTNHRNLPPDCKLKQEGKTRCCTRRRTGIRRPVPSYYEGTAHPIPVLLRMQHLVFLSCFSLRAGGNLWSSKFKFQRQLEFKIPPFCSYLHPPSPQRRHKPACRVYPGANKFKSRFLTAICPCALQPRSGRFFRGRRDGTTLKEPVVPEGGCWCCARLILLRHRSPTRPNAN